MQSFTDFFAHYCKTVRDDRTREQIIAIMVEGIQPIIDLSDKQVLCTLPRFGTWVMEETTDEWIPVSKFQNPEEYSNSWRLAVAYHFKGRLLPRQVRLQIERYVQHRLDPGSFLRATLESDLYRAYKGCDPEMLPLLHLFPHNYAYELPAGIWGSPEKVAEHIYGAR